VLEYRVRTRKKAPAAAIIERLHAEGVPHVVAAESSRKTKLREHRS